MNKTVKEQLQRIDAEHIRKLTRLAFKYNTTPLVVIYGLIDKQYEIIK